MSITIVTGASQNHAKTLAQFLRSIPNSGLNVQCYVYDLGLNPDSLESIQKEFPSCIYRTFDYSKYPSYFNIQVNAGEYAWKPTLIAETAREIKSGILLWFDAGDKIQGDLHFMIDVVKSQNIYTPFSPGTIKDWTHPKTLEYFSIPEDSNLLSKNNRNGAMIGFDLDSDRGMKFVEEFARLAGIKECIAPEGSDRSNHRQDQAVLTLLYYSFFGDSQTYDHYINFGLHCDID